MNIKSRTGMFGSLFSISAMFSQAMELIHSGAGLVGCDDLSTSPAPLKKYWYSSLSILADRCKILTHIWKEKRSLCQKTWGEILQRKYGFDFDWVGEIRLANMEIYWATPGKQFTIVNINNFDSHGYGEQVIESGIIL